MPTVSQRLHMKNILIVIVSFIAVFLIAINNWGEPSGRYYSCRDIDFLPDVPPQVRVECRKLIKEKLDEERKRNLDNTGYIT
jgi:hypothetical protein